MQNFYGLTSCFFNISGGREPIFLYMPPNDMFLIIIECKMGWWKAIILYTPKRERQKVTFLSFVQLPIRKRVTCKEKWE